MARRVGVIAISVAGSYAIRVAIALGCLNRSIAVVIESVTNLDGGGTRRTRIDRCEAESRRETLTGSTRGWKPIHMFITVVVDAVAALEVSWEPGGVLIVAVARAGERPVGIYVYFAHERQSVAVVVEAIAQLRVPGVALPA